MAVRSILPVCDGPHGVACVDLMEPNGVDGRVGLFFRVFYPTDKFTPDPNSNTDSTPWMPHEGYVQGFAEYGTLLPLLGGLLKRYLRNSLTKMKAQRRVPVRWGAPLKEGDRYPVVLLSSGWTGTRFMHSALSCSLAAQGFVVFAPEHGDGSACWTYRGNDQNSIPHPVKWMKNPDAHMKEFLEHVKARGVELERCMELVQKLDKGESLGPLDLGADFDWTQFQDRLDLARQCLMGHSFGGPSVLSVIANGKQQFHCAVILDGNMMMLPKSMYAEILARQIPILFINADLKFKMEVERRLQLVQEGSFNRMVTIKNSGHFSFCDMTILPRFLAGSSINPKLCNRITMDLAMAFIAGSRERELDALRADGQLLHPETVLEPTTEAIKRKLVKDFKLEEGGRRKIVHN